MLLWPSYYITTKFKPYNLTTTETLGTIMLITRGIHCTMAIPRNWHCLGCRNDLQNRKWIITITAVYKNRPLLPKQWTKFDLPYGSWMLILIVAVCKENPSGTRGRWSYFDNRYQPSIPTIDAFVIILYNRIIKGPACWHCVAYLLWLMLFRSYAGTGI